MVQLFNNDRILCYAFSQLTCVLLQWCVIFCSPCEFLLVCIPFLAAAVLLQTAKQFVPWLLILQYFGYYSFPCSSLPEDKEAELCSAFKKKKEFSSQSCILDFYSKLKSCIFQSVPLCIRKKKKVLILTEKHQLKDRSLLT